MENSNKSTVEKIGKELINLLSQDDSSKNISLQLDEISEIYSEKQKHIEVLLDTFAKMKLALYIEARHLQTAFFEESILEAKKRNTFFKYSVNVNYRKDPFDFESYKNETPEKAGSIESIYWYKRNGRKVDGKVKYFIARIPFNDPEGISYKRRAFAGGIKWQVDLIMKYEEKFAKIRKAIRMIGEFKRKTRLLNICFDDIYTILKEMENHDLNASITNEENDNDIEEELKEE